MIAALFLQPGRWPLLLVAPAAFALSWWLDRRRARTMSRIAGAGTGRVSSLSRSRRRGRRALFAAGLAFAGVAAMAPAWGAARNPVEPRGADVVLCLDVSRSMLARDLKPSRLERAQAEIAALCDAAGGNRLGLVLFAGDARLAAPLTRDLATIATLARRAGPLSVERGGSDPGQALDTALAALSESAGEHAAVVLLTDGEDHDGEAQRAAEACAARGVTVHCIGYGSERGAKIPIAGTDGDFYLRDRAGAEVVTALKPADLARIADAADGAFLDASRSADALAALFSDRIEVTARAAHERRADHERENRFQWPLLLAFLCWIVELWLGERRS